MYRLSPKRRRHHQASRTWRALAPAGLTAFGFVSACGRVGLVSERPRDGSDGRPDATAIPSFDANAANDGAVDTPRSDSGPRDAEPEATPPFDARIPDSATPRDAAADARDAAEDRAPSDARTTPDCACPPDNYYVDATVNGVSVHLSYAFPLGLYCDETEPELAHPPCGSVYRLTACAEPGGKPPCLYVSVDGRAPVIGDYIDSTGQTFDLVSGEIPPPTTTNGRDATGTFSAIYASKTNEATVTVVGTFRACLTLFAPCGS